MSGEGNRETEAPIAAICREYVHSVEALAESLPQIMTVLTQTQRRYETRMEEFLDAHASAVKRDERGRTYTLAIQDTAEHDKLVRRRRVFREALGVTPRSFVVSLISAHDAFLGRLIRSVFYTRPELLNGSDRVLTFSQLQDLKTVEAAREYLVEKEVETVLRKSHAAQFEWMEKTFAVPLRKGLDCWPVFIELTERRNLFVHADGIVNSQYLTVCRDHDVPLEDGLRGGERLHVRKSYYEKSARCMIEIGVKLAHVLWRKFDPDTRGEADENLNHLIYEFLVKRQYQLAAELASFAAFRIKTHASEQYRRMFVVNLAITYKHGDQHEECAAVLDREDWSATSGEFRVAIAALRDEFEHAAKIMRTIGKEGSPGVFGYRNWPVFRDFRKSDEFASAYADVFGEAFAVRAQEPGDDPSETRG